MRLCLYKIICVSALTVLSTASCIKEGLTLSEFDANRINMVVADNFNLSSFTIVLQRSQLDKELQSGKGPYTLLAPSDAAFQNAGYNSPDGVRTVDSRVIGGIARYHMIDGRYELDKLPFVFNQELYSRGGRLYATRWIKGTDTVLTVNGSRIVAENIPASNGVIQVIDRVLTPYVHDRMGDAIAADPNTTLFSQALQSSGLLDEINGEGPFTVFAPNNAAMQDYGLQNVQQILQTDREQLRALVRYHVVRDRRFVYDYILSTGEANASRQTMMDNNVVNVTLLPDENAPGSFNGILLRGTGNTGDVTLVEQDFLIGNGVLHVVDGVLRVNQ